MQTIEVELPSGVILEDVPSNLTDAQIRAGAIAQGLATPEDFISMPAYSTGLAREALQGASLGWADEIGLGAASLAGSLKTGEPVSDVYSKMRTRYDAEQGRFRSQNPGTALAAEIGGSVATGGVGVAKAIAAGVPKAAAMAGTGTLGGGLYGAGTDHDARTVGAMQGAAIGGVASPLIGLGVPKMAQSLDKSKIMSAIRESAPSKDSIAQSANALYRQAKDSGIVIKESSYQQLSDRVNTALKGLGFNARIHPKVAAAVDDITKHEGPIDIGELDNLRRIVGSAARSNEADERRIGTKLLGIIDDKMDSLSAGDVISGNADDVGSILRQARNLWGRKRRLDLIEDAFDKAKNQASGIENGIRIQFRQILQNPNKRRGFSTDEIALMEKVVRGGTGENLMKLLGKFGFSENQATNYLGAMIGIGGGAAVGGPVGAVAVPMIGQAAKSQAQRMTRNNASNLAAAVARGVTPDAAYRQIVANPNAAYGLIQDPALAEKMRQVAQRNYGLLGNIGAGVGLSLGGQF